MDDNETILRRLHAQANVGHILGAVAGSGLTAKLAVLGGADILLALSAGRYRIMGRSSLNAFLCYDNSNKIVMEMGCREILPVVHTVPLLFGFLAGDPSIQLYDYLNSIRKNGFAGIVNSPTVALIDGKFRQGLEREGTSYDREVAAIRMASHMGMLTMAFVTNRHEAKQMIEAGADMLCLHLGLTRGGLLGAKRFLSIGEARDRTEDVFAFCKEHAPEVLRLIYAGPANTLMDMQYLYNKTSCQGYIGGSTFDRIPMEKQILATVQSFKHQGAGDAENPISRILDRTRGEVNLIDSIRRYIDEHYMEEIQLSDIALVAHISASYLGARFKKEMGRSFTDYLLHFRLDKAMASMCAGATCKEAAQKAGYSDYSQFSKMFRKHIGEPPKEWRKRQLTKTLKDNTINKQ